MSVDLQAIKKALVARGLEVLRARGVEVHLAERQNLQLMDAGVRIESASPLRVHVVVRAQQVDAAGRGPDEMRALVRQRSTGLVEHGFHETAWTDRAIRSVSDPTQILDVWYEITFSRDAGTLDEAVDLAAFGIGEERYVRPR